jgi:hypothetical protein
MNDAGQGSACMKQLAGILIQIKVPGGRCFSIQPLAFDNQENASWPNGSTGFAKIFA